MLFKNKLRENNKKNSYSQSGEDMIVDFVFTVLKIESPSYLDIGAHHPYYLSNTAYFYEKKSFGVSVEPDPYLFEVIKKERPNEISLNVGVGLKSGDKADFYIMDVPTLNTFSKEEAERYVSFGNRKIKKVVELPLITVNNIIERYFNDKCPNFISLDVEGMDMEIVNSFDFNKYRPEVFCIETITYTEDNSEKKLQDIIDFMINKGYFIYADTYINTIFVDQIKWKNR